jgi:hypothetical protein
MKYRVQNHKFRGLKSDYKRTKILTDKTSTILYLAVIGLLLTTAEGRAQHGGGGLTFSLLIQGLVYFSLPDLSYACSCTNVLPCCDETYATCKKRTC